MNIKDNYLTDTNKNLEVLPERDELNGIRQDLPTVRRIIVGDDWEEKYNIHILEIEKEQILKLQQEEMCIKTR